MTSPATVPSAPVGRGIDPCRLYLAAAGGVTLWLIATVLWHFTFASGRVLGHVLFLQQDFPALLIGIIGLMLAAPFIRGGKGVPVPPPSAAFMLPLIALAALWAWAGHDIVFHGYALSRDEEVAEFAAAYLRDGMAARPIPPEWIDYRRAIMPEFFSPYGAGQYWTAAYLPVNSLVRALFWRLGDPALAGAAFLAIGLVSLWRIALRLFPQRPDAVWVTMLLALTSAQLSVTAMTPYAMTGHFALNLLWLALLLRGGVTGHVCAGMVALVAGGLHQWHFPPIMLLPFIGWLLLQRRWSAAAFHLAVVALLVVIWAKLWPAFLLHELGPPSDVRPTAGVGDKVGSLIDRLGDKWQPLFNLSRMLAWNPVLMVPLAFVAMACMKWRAALRGEEIVLPLAITCIIGCALALAQGYGWGYRYGHGYIGLFCLLAGFGWQKVSGSSAGRLTRPVLTATVLALGAAGFLTMRAHDYVLPYARAHQAIHAAKADVVLVDPRGGLFATDLVRAQQGTPGKPMVMNLMMLDQAEIDRLCGAYRVVLFDRNDFAPLGVPPSRMNRDRAGLREHMDDIGCGLPPRQQP
ncbi:MFS transporter [Sphingobium sp. H39-3-25]|uniref:MFS transporter n=1 Tax=Sphingobium arseniciresistens TaxID=3030834 RepID=UPI0023B9D9CD|nr:MFS transporter [Sphingobium arseniciresistens]